MAWAPKRPVLPTLAEVPLADLSSDLDGVAAGDEGGNLNGPSAILAPEWLPDRLGRYYLYLTHHRGRSIRLAFADRLSGPWTIHAPGSLRVEDLQGQWDHIASPDVHVDHAQRRIRMYFHGQRAGDPR